MACGVDLDGTDAVFLRDHFFNFLASPFHHVRSIGDIFEDTVNRGMRPLGLAEWVALEAPPCPPLARLATAFVRADHARAAQTAAGSDDPARTWRLLRHNPLALRVEPELEGDLWTAESSQGSAASDAAGGVSRHADAGGGISRHADAAGGMSRQPLDVGRNCWNVTPAEARERYLSRMQDLQHLQRCLAAERHTVVIVGAGPAGLMRAVQAALHGHVPTVIEKRPRDGRGRPHIVVMRSRVVVEMLEFLGVFDFLRSERCLFPPARLGVEIRIGDLERALEAVLEGLGGSAPLWGHQVVAVGLTAPCGDVACAENGADGAARDGRHACVEVANARGERLVFRPDVLVIADGTHSPTSALIGIERADRLPEHTGITGVQADRWEPGGLTRALLYFLGDLRCRLTYRVRRLLGAGRNLAGGSVLQVPGQNYVGVSVVGDVEAGFDHWRRRLEMARMRLQAATVQQLEMARTRLQAATVQQREAADMGHWRREEARARYVLRRMLKRWVEFGFEAVRSSPTPAVPNCGGRPIPWFPLDLERTSTFPMIAQRAASACGTMGDTIVVLEGDAHCTVYPESGFGCSKSLMGARLFDFMLRGLALLPDLRDDVLRAVSFSKAVESREITRISNLFNETAARKFQTPYGDA